MVAPSGQFFCLLAIGGPLKSVSSQLYGGPSDQFFLILYGVPQTSFFAYYMGAPSHQFLYLLYMGPPQVNFFAYHMEPLYFFSIFCYPWGAILLNFQEGQVPPLAPPLRAPMGTYIHQTVYSYTILRPL